MAAAIAIQGLTKKYLDVWNKQEVVAVNNLNLDGRGGRDFRLSGPQRSRKNHDDQNAARPDFPDRRRRYPSRQTDGR